MGTVTGSSVAAVVASSQKTSAGAPVISQALPAAIQIRVMTHTHAHAE